MKLYIQKSLLTFLMIGSMFPVICQQSFSLQEAIRYGLQNHNSIKMSDIDMETSEKDIDEVKSIGLPKVNGSVDYNYYFYIPIQPIQDFISPAVYGILEAEGLPTTTQREPETFELSFVQPQQLNIGISASSLLFDGSYLYGLKAARLYRNLVRKQKNATEEQVKINITKAYLSILIAKENKNTIHDNMITLDKSLSEVKEMYSAGFVESLDVDRLQLSHDNLHIQEENIQGLIELSHNLLKFQMGFPMEDRIDLSEGIEELILKFDTQIIGRNAPIDPKKRAQFQLLNTSQELNGLDIKRHQAGYYPNVAAFASFQESLQRRSLFDGEETGFLPIGVLGLSINVPIYDGGQKSAKIQKVKLRIQKTDLQKEEFVRGMKLQVQNAQIAIQNANRNLDNSKKTLATTKSIFEKTQIKFSEGIGSSIEVTLAESDLYAAQAQVIEALYDLLQAKVDIDIAFGNL